MDTERPVDTTPALDRQPRSVRRDVHGRPLVPTRVPETRPTPLQDAFIPLSIVVLICGAVAISALELGVPLGSPLVKLAVLVGGVTLAAVTVDAILRIWRSAFAWLAVDRGMGAFRFLWVATLALSLVVLAVILAVVVTA